ncbi:MAG: DUF3368 domain-containing protein [Armatimonadetes bacterium]|nr:DUF3368 domain-containing protein [Armatimonadota bacterium]
MDRRWVCNSSPLIVLGKVGLIELLLRMADHLRIPVSVAEEVAAGPVTDPGRQWLARAGRRWVAPDADADPAVAAWDLGGGETAVLSLCSLDKGLVAVLDDLAARRCARMLQVRVIGTVGVLVLAKSEGLLDSVSRAITDLERVGFRLSDELRRAAIARAGEFNLD